MLKSLLTLLIIVSACGTIAEAKTMKVPSGEAPVVSVEIPDSWNPEELTNGVTGANEDVDIVVVTAAEKKKDQSADLADAFAILRDHSVEVDQASKKVSKIQINGIEAEKMQFEGKETLGKHTDPVSITIVTLPVKDKVVVLTEFVATEDAKKSREAVDKIIKSLKPAS
jgi:hypothetical protein